MSWSHDDNDVTDAEIESGDIKKPKSSRSGSNDYSPDFAGDVSVTRITNQFLSNLNNFHEHRKRSLSSHIGGNGTSGGFKSIGNEIKNGDGAGRFVV